jgi:hypothetical protein
MNPVMYRIARWIADHRTGVSIFSWLVYPLILFPATVILFPDSNLWLGMAIMWVGWMQEWKDLADQLEDDANESDARQNR